jgi:hypothetical protein
MSVTNSTQGGLFKIRYGEVIDLTEKKFTLQDMWKFDATNTIGDTFNDDILVTMSHGFVQGGLNDLSGLTVTTDRPSTSVQSAVSSAPVLAFRNVTYAEHIRAEKAGAQAFATFLDKRVLGLINGLRTKVEMNMLYGRSTDGIGSVNAISGTGTSRVLTFTSDATATHYNTFAQGMWTGLEGIELDLATYAAPTVVINTNAPLVLTAVSAGTITVSCNSTDGGLLDTALGAVCCLFLRGTCNIGAYGLDYAMRATGSTSVWGIAVNSYSNWIGNTQSLAGNRLTFEDLLIAAATIENRGYEGKLKLLINPKTFQNLISDQAALRQYVGEGLPSEFATGARKLLFGTGGTVIEVAKHKFIKPREGFLVREDGGRRVGSTDITSGTAGMGDFRVNLYNISSWQYRLFADMAFYHPFFSHCLKFTDINNAA